MCGRSRAPKPPNPMRVAEAEIKKMQEQMRLQEEMQLRGEQRAAEERARQEAERRAQLDASVAGARNDTINNLMRLGVDTSDQNVIDTIERILRQESAAIGPTGPAALDPGVSGRIQEALRQDAIRGKQQQINQFAPMGFAQQAFGRDMKDPILSSILGDQFNDASDAILRAFHRGNLSQQGFDYAMNNLNNQRSAAEARARSIGGGILGDYQSQLDALANNARQAAGNWQFGDPFDVGFFENQINQRRDDLTNRFEGDFRNALGGEQFFNWNDLIRRAGVRQGATNTSQTTPALLQAFGERKQQEEQSRGLGSQGAF